MAQFSVEISVEFFLQDNLKKKTIGVNSKHYEILAMAFTQIRYHLSKKIGYVKSPCKIHENIASRKYSF